jgi:hypothetical protein
MHVGMLIGILVLSRLVEIFVCDKKFLPIFDKTWRFSLKAMLRLKIYKHTSSN